MGKGFDLGGLFRQAQQLQEKIANIQQELAERTVEASAGGGMVTAVVSGKLEVVQLRIEPSLLEKPDGDMLPVKDEPRLCSVCFALTEADPCPMCTDPARLADAICVVEEPADLLAVERAREFRGRYHVLHGALAPLDGVGPDELKIQPLLVRLRDGAVREVILATNPTAEGEATALYLARLIKPLGIRVTRIAHGIPVGGDLEYVDVVTVGRALEGRREM